MSSVLIASLIAATPVTTLGVNLGSWHDQPGFNNVNPGVYVVHRSGWAGGVLRNSHHKDSFWAGRVFNTADNKWALTVGGITGYPSGPVSPLATLSRRVELSAGYALRVHLLPKPPIKGGSAAVHFSLEVKVHD